MSVKLKEEERKKIARLKPGEVPILVSNITDRLELNIGRWHKIHYGRCRPSYLYIYNKHKDKLDDRVTMRGVTQCLRGETNYYYAMILPGGIKSEFSA